VGTRDSGIGGEQMVNSQAGAMLSVSSRSSAGQLSIAVIGPDELLRISLLDALNRYFTGNLHDFVSYPPTLLDVNNLMDQKHDIVMIELDSDPDYALELIRTVCAGGNSSVMVYSRMPNQEVPDSDLLLRCMRLGAREFLNLPFAGEELKEALERAAVRHSVSYDEPEKARGRLFVFCGVKGGAGVTNIACNFAVTLANYSPEKVLLIDMDLPLGDAALNLGIRPRYSTLDALQNHSRIDSSFLSKLLVSHDSGLALLPAPGRFPGYLATNEAVDRLLRVARQDFENVVVDAGSKFDLANACAEYRDATILYLITQSGIPELRNANRLIGQYRTVDGPKLEIVLNRYERDSSGITEDELKRALTCAVSWKIPNDYRAVRKMQDTSAPIVATDSLIARQIEAMVCAACGLPALRHKKEFSWRGWFAPARKKARRSDLPAAGQLGLIVDKEEPLALRPDMPGPVRTDSADEPCCAPLDGRRSSAWNC
jgi:pilus assembly protein CpaE